MRLLIARVKFVILLVRAIFAAARLVGRFLRYYKKNYRTA